MKSHIGYTKVGGASFICDTMSRLIYILERHSQLIVIGRRELTN